MSSKLNGISKIINWCRLNDYNLFETFNSGLTEKEIVSFQNVLNVPFCPEFIDYLKHMNGQSFKSTLIVPLYKDIFSLSTTEKILSDWDLMNEYQQQSDSYRNSDKEIKNKFWDAKWIPFKSSYSGDYICIDYNPTKYGIYGQIFRYNLYGDLKFLSQGLNSFFDIEVLGRLISSY